LPMRIRRPLAISKGFCHRLALSGGPWRKLAELRPRARSR
jgi:hypothetical protein